MTVNERSYNYLTYGLPPEGINSSIAISFGIELFWEVKQAAHQMNMSVSEYLRLAAEDLLKLESIDPAIRKTRKIFTVSMTRKYKKRMQALVNAHKYSSMSEIFRFAALQKLGKGAH